MEQDTLLDRFFTQQAALGFARSCAKVNRPSVIEVLDQDGNVRQTIAYGADGLNSGSAGR